MLAFYQFVDSFMGIERGPLQKVLNLWQAKYGKWNWIASRW